MAVVGPYAARVPIDYGMEQFFPSFGIERETYDEYKTHFSKEDTQFALFWDDERGPGLGLYRDLQKAAGFFEDVGLTDVQWFGNVDVTETVQVDGEVATRIYRLVEEPDLTDATIRGMLERHRTNDLYRGYLWNSDQTVFAVHGYLEPELNTDQRRREVEEALTAALASLGDDHADVRLAGLPVFRSRIPKMLEVDERLFLGGGFLVFFGVLLFFFRHVGHVTLCLVSVLPAYLCAVALMGLTGRSISILTSFIPIIVLVVGGSDAIHLLARYRHNRSELASNDDAIVRTFSQLSVACFYTSITTAIGFLSLVGTRIGMVMEFGFFTAVAILLTYAFSMTLLPALLGLSARLRFNDRGLSQRWIQQAVKTAIALPRRRARTVVLLFAFVSLVGLALGSTLGVNTFLINDMSRDSPVIRDMQWIEASGFGLFQVNVFLRNDGEGDLHDPVMLAWMADFEEFARGESIVIDAIALSDVMTELRGAVGDVGLPQSREEAAQLLFLADLNGGGGVEDVYLRDEGVAQIVLAVRDEGSESMLPFLGLVDRYLEDHPPPVGTAATTGTVQMKQAYTAQLVSTFGPSLALAILLVFGVMTHMFRSVRLGLLALLPNIFPLLVLLGAMKVGGVDLKPSTILVFSIAFGLAVDDTMHFLSRVKESLDGGTQLQRAVEDSLRDTGPAILMTSVAMSAGFLVLVGSQFEILVLVGVMTGVSVIAAVCADLFLLPSLIAVLPKLAASGGVGHNKGRLP